MNTDNTLDELRKEIDSVDDLIHDLIIRRARIIEKVRSYKKSQLIKIRPSREDRIAFRLMERHRGVFPKRELLRIWREIIVATLSLEGSFSAAVLTNGKDCRALDSTRDHYGSFTSVTSMGSALQVINAVRNNDVTVGILPLPKSGDEAPWWHHLVAEGQNVPRVISRLPFIAPRGGRPPEAEFLVVCSVVRSPSGRDRSYLALETGKEIGSDRFRKALSDSGLEPLFQDSYSGPHLPDLKLHLVEVDSYVSPDDERIEACLKALGKSAVRAVVLGGYARPLTDAELAPAAD